MDSHTNAIAYVGFTVFAIVVSFAAGWLAAHSEVSTECARQGSFYFGSKDFTCAPKQATGAQP